INSVGIADTVYLRGAYQRTSYSMHQQGGIIASYAQRVSEQLDITVGGEYRRWTANHPGHFTNMYGGTSATRTYEFRVNPDSAATFSRRVYQGDMTTPGGVDVGSVFGWEMANDPTYATQYRNYRGETPQYTLYAQANVKPIQDLTILGSLQYVWYSYKLTENMPSESGVAQRELTPAQATAAGISSEGKAANGLFYMLGTNGNYYEFELVNATRSRGFLQPKVGANYNINENINVFGNFAHVERFTDLSIYYNSGNLNPDAEDEKSNQYEFVLCCTSSTLQAKVNLYTMTWDNKAARIQDVSKAGQPGYDRNGFRSELIGSSRNQGIEFEFTASLDKYLPVAGFQLRGSYTYMDNTWTKVLDEVKVDPTGARRPFNTSAYNAQGVRYTQYFDELENTPVASQAQQMGSLGLSYSMDGYFIGLDMNHFSKFIALDGGTYFAIDGEFSADGRFFTPKWSDRLPATWVWDFQLGGRYEAFGVRGDIRFQIINLFDSEYLASSDRYGVLPGALRTFRFSMSAGI
ncbi:MAG: TonB-dependent receptor, partial [Proteobacteria bacterium]|nr:TonB-dependent receptor [Pseudomonadota bacterium]